MTAIHRHSRLLRAAAAATVAALLGALMAAPPAAADGPDGPDIPHETPALVTDVSVEQAVAQARTSGKAVEATAATSATDLVTANPDGTITEQRSAVPVRA